MSKHAYDIRDATRADAVELAPKLRQADIDELKAVGKEDALKVLKESLKASRSPRVLTVDGEVVAIFGAGKVTLLSEMGIPWLLGSPQIENHAKAFLRRSRGVIAGWRKEFSYLCNFVDARNTHAIRWLQWLGFDILPAQVHGSQDMMFHKFEMRVM